MCAGFTIIEMVVVLAIISILTGIVFSGRGEFNSSVVLSSTAYDIALTIRNAQSYGLSSRAINSDLLGVGYGVHFVKNATTIIVFKDSIPSIFSKNANYCNYSSDTSKPDAHPGDCIYTNASESYQTLAIGNGIQISDLCVYSGATCLSANKVDLSSVRPNPSITITKDGDKFTFLKQACITVSSPQSGSRYILVNNSGSITTNVSKCP